MVLVIGLEGDFGLCVGHDWIICTPRGIQPSAHTARVIGALGRKGGVSFALVPFALTPVLTCLENARIGSIVDFSQPLIDTNPTSPRTTALQVKYTVIHHASAVGDIIRRRGGGKAKTDTRTASPDHTLTVQTLSHSGRTNCIKSSAVGRLL